MIASGIQNILESPVIAMLFAFFIAALLRIALGISPVWIAIACHSGSLCCGHVNDSRFWVSTNLSGFSISGGLKTYTMGGALFGCTAMILAMIGALIF